jgi:hypothetical protein
MSGAFIDIEVCDPSSSLSVPHPIPSPLMLLFNPTLLLSGCEKKVEKDLDLRFCLEMKAADPVVDDEVVVEGVTVVATEAEESDRE